jgi:hypothetical protein
MKINLAQLLFEGDPPPPNAKAVTPSNTADATTAATATTAAKEKEEPKGVQNINKIEKSACLQNAKAGRLYTKCTKALQKIKLKEFKDDATALAILLSIISVESRCNINVSDSRFGGVGLMQLTPIALKEIKFTGDINDDVQNIIAGIKMVNFISDKFISKEKDKKVRQAYATAGYLGRVAWIMLAYNNGYYAAKRELAKGTSSEKTRYYNDVKEFYRYWSAPSVLKNLIVNEYKVKEAVKDKDKDKDKNKDKNKNKNIIPKKNTPVTTPASTPTPAKPTPPAVQNQVKTESIDLLTKYIRQLLV